MTTNSSTYSVGTPGTPWGDNEKAQWLANQSVKRSYQDEVLSKLEPLSQHFVVEQYGALSCDPARYPLHIVKTRNWNNSKPTILVTGGVHGYETSGVQGAIRFLETVARDYEQHFNVVVAPCVSPWGYETINRWNPKALDPNRSFYSNSPAEEAAFLMAGISKLSANFALHIDLHETTDTDNSEFRPALAARDGIKQKNWNIPDGFYLVGDTEDPQPEFQKAVIESVEKVTHIAPPDDNGQYIGAPQEQWGVINYSAKKLGLCFGMTNARFRTTTEVYPDSPNVDDENCIQAQVAAVRGALKFLI
ncbi:M14 family metallocarboxypeptidase [Porticoccaceae bacterium LTM1]|nr:M14 family metallocarboxypeptidase [Porticoccaceae bacterium LTM1]